MKVKNWIHREPIIIKRTVLLQEAVKLMKQYDIRHLPVVEDGELIGFVTESDLRQFSFPSMVENIPVHQVMVINPLTIEADATIEEAAKILHDNKIGGLPVLEEGTLVGVITASDLLSAFIEVIGLLKSTTRIDVIVNDEKGGLDVVTRIIKENGGEVINVAMDTTKSKKKVYYFRLENCDVSPVVKALEKNGHQVVSVMD